MKNKLIIKIILFSLIFNLTFQGFCEDIKNSDDIQKEEIPQGIQDFRRFEIITLGSMPFVTLDATLGYSVIKYSKELADGNKNATFPNPFKSSGDGGYSDDEIKGIILTSFGICLGIGISDLIVNIVKRNRSSSKKNKNNLNIMRIEDDPDAIKIEFEEKNNQIEENINDSINETENLLNDELSNESYDNSDNVIFIDEIGEELE